MAQRGECTGCGCDGDCCCEELRLRRERVVVMGRAGYRISWTLPAACMTARANARGGGSVAQLELYAGQCPGETDLMEVLNPADGHIDYTLSEWVELFPDGRLCVVARGANGVALARCDWCLEKDNGVEPPYSPSPSPSPSPPDPDPPERWWPCEITDVVSVYSEVDLPGYVTPPGGLNAAPYDGVFSFSVTTSVEVFSPTPEEGHIHTEIIIYPGAWIPILTASGGPGAQIVPQFITRFVLRSGAGGDSPVPGDGLVEFLAEFVLPAIPDTVTIRSYYVLPGNTAAPCTCPFLNFPSMRCNEGNNVDDRSVYNETIAITV